MHDHPHGHPQGVPVQGALPAVGTPFAVDAPPSPRRKSLRLKGYDYSQTGLYFITICTEGRKCLFGEVGSGEMAVNDAGKMVAQQWHELTGRFGQIELHEFVVMPNHFHGIVEIIGGGHPIDGHPQEVPLRIHDFVGAPLVGALHPQLGTIVGAFKSLTMNAYIQGARQQGWAAFKDKLWQRNYYEHVIRNETSYLQISEYIQTNPLKWLDDKYYGE